MDFEKKRDWKKYGFLLLAFALTGIFVFFPGYLMKKGDEKAFGVVHVENVSPGRNALLATLSLEERIKLYCDSHMNYTDFLFGWISYSESDTLFDAKEPASVKVEYAYEIEEMDVFEKYMTELDRLIKLNIVPAFVADSSSKVQMTGKRMYLYDEQEDKGVVCVCLERMNKDGSGIRMVTDEDSGKIIAFYVFNERMEKENYLGPDIMENYLSYLEISFGPVKTDKMDLYCEVAGGNYYYRIFKTGNEYAVYPLK